MEGEGDLQYWDLAAYASVVKIEDNMPAGLPPKLKAAAEAESQPSALEKEKIPKKIGIIPDAGMVSIDLR